MEFQITSQVHGNVIQPSGTIATGYTIHVTDLQTGVPFSVFLPDDKYNADNARTLILAQLEHVRAVHSLTS